MQIPSPSFSPSKAKSQFSTKKTNPLKTLLLHFFGSEHKLFHFFAVIFVFVLGVYVGALSLDRVLFLKLFQKTNNEQQFMSSSKYEETPPTAITLSTSPPSPSSYAKPDIGKRVDGSTKTPHAAFQSSAKSIFETPLLKMDSTISLKHITDTIDVPDTKQNMFSLINTVYHLHDLGHHISFQDLLFLPSKKKILRVKEPYNPEIFFRGCVSPSRPYILTHILQMKQKKIPQYRQWWASDKLLAEKFAANQVLLNAKLWVSSPTRSGLHHVSVSKEERDSMHQMPILQFLQQYKSDSLFLPYAPVGQMEPSFAFTQQYLRAPNPNTLLSIGSGGEVTSIHQLPFETFQCQFAGRSTITLYHPLSYPNLYTASHPSVFKMSKSKHSTSSFLVSKIDPSMSRSRNKRKFPLFSQLTPSVVHINQGECIYIPSYWFVSFKNRKERNVRVTFLYEPHSENWSLLWKIFSIDKKQDTIPSISSQ